jgi:succinate dehydrogenase / fumarate reductase iron-sulfur subunit
MATKTVQFEIKRQASPDAPAVWEKFELEWRPGMNVISAMMEIAANPVTADGRPTTPITYDSNCLEEICGSCAMLINGRARMACSALVDKLTGPNLDQTITLAPLSKFPIVRDLQVDRSVLFENLKAVQAWVPIDGTYDLGAGPRQFPQIQEQRYPLSNCISCCCCMEVCPQFNDSTNFVGAATIAQVKLFNMDPAGAVLKEERLRALAGDGGIQECGFAQNCVEACPKQLPLTEAISDISRDVIVQQVKDLFTR